MDETDFVQREDGVMSIKEIDKGIKNKFKWSWMDEQDLHGDRLSEYICKPREPGVAWCKICKDRISYGSAGKKAIIKHALIGCHRRKRSILKSDLAVSLVNTPSSASDKSPESLDDCIPLHVHFPKHRKMADTSGVEFDLSTTMDGSDWEPPSEAEMKLIQARRERSDKISKLMGDYLLKGYKMLGTLCSTCDTILLQDRQGNNYCVACSELDTDTGKDDPVTNQSAAMSMAREVELASAGAASAQLETGSKEKGSTPAKTMNSSLTPRALLSQSGRLDISDDSAQILSMSSIDIQSWPSNPDSGRDQNGAVPQSELSIKLEPVPGGGGDSDSGLHSLSGDNHMSPLSQRGRNQATTARSPLSSALSSNTIGTLCEKIEWASKELKGTPSVEYSIQLCTLIKSAAEAVSAVRAARI